MAKKTNVKSQAKGKPSKKVSATATKSRSGVATRTAPPARREPRPKISNRLPVPLPTNNNGSSADTGPLTEAQIRKVKTGLSRKDMEHYRELLLTKRAEILGDVESLEGDARNNTSGNLSHMPLHMADVGSDNYEQEFTLGLVESERRLLHEITEALIRIDRGTFGVCQERGIAISRVRLDAKPWAKFCIEVERERERMGRR